MPRRFLSLCLCLVASVAACSPSAPPDATSPVPLTWSVAREPSGAFADAARACSEGSEGRYRIEIEELPADADRQRLQMVRRLAAGDPALDILSLDVVWTPELAEAGWLSPFPAETAARIARGTFAPSLETGSWTGRLWAAPLTANTQLLWYRTDLVDEPPETWDELVELSADLAARSLPHSAQVQGARYEGLVVWFNSLLESAGGSVLGPDGERLALDPGPLGETLALMRRFARSTAAAPGLANAREDDARLAFEAGRSAFMVNYTYVWPSARANAPEIARVMGWARWPAVSPESPSRVTLGGLDLAVSAFSPHPELAREAILCLRREEHQRSYAVRGGLLPTSRALYDDPELRRALPFADLLAATLADAAVRPRTPAYNDLSLALQRSLHPPREIAPRATSERLRELAELALSSRGLL